MLEKIADILKTTEKPALRYHIVKRCSLSSKTFRAYITQLLEAGLLDAYPVVDSKLDGRQTTHRMIYQTSPKGMEFLKRYSELLSLMGFACPAKGNLKSGDRNKNDKRKTTYIQEI